jgi:alpha-ketoglutaric semialdehyde dehydrogenase
VQAFTEEGANTLNYSPFIDGLEEMTQPRQTISSYNPTTGEKLTGHYPVSTFAELEAAVDNARSAAGYLGESSPEIIARFLETYADRIETNGDEICRMAALETGLPYEPRLKMIELTRTTDQLRQAGAAVRERSWRMATIDNAANIRSMYTPLNGPVLIFGPNNFPLAFNAVSGGDFAAAIAAGNPVIAKAHPGHLGTSRLLAEAAWDALDACRLPRGIVQMFYHCAPGDGLKLVAHPGVAAAAFTGSRGAGLALKQAADAAGKPIYLEMSSVNPVFILPGALAERGEAIAVEFFGSCTLASGQFCTNPGLLIVPQGHHGEKFLRTAAALFKDNPSGPLLSKLGAANIQRSLSILQEAGAEIATGGEGDGFQHANTLLRISGEVFQTDPASLQTEAFGPVALVVIASDTKEMAAVAASLEGNLTGSIYSDSQGYDDAAYDQLAPVLVTKVGRLLNDKMPTGVAVSPAMVHGGPFPATGHPGFTAVGIPASIHRFAALRCYDNVRQHRLPPELRDENPTGEMWRLVDGRWTQENIVAKVTST